MKKTLVIAMFFACSAYAEVHDYGSYKIGEPYTVEGKTFYPKEVSSLMEKGLASWYGDEFNGKQTANGAVFNKNTRTVAHRTLPMPSAVLIRNLENGNQTIAVVTDRGPFARTHERVLDASQKVAEELDFISKGSAMVEIEYLPVLSAKLKKGERIDIDEYITKYDIIKGNTYAVAMNAVPEQSVVARYPSNTEDIRSKTVFTKGYAKNFYAQIGVFEELPNAQKLYEKMVNDISNVQIRSENRDSKLYYVIRSGPFETQQEAESIISKVPSYCSDCHPIVITI